MPNINNILKELKKRKVFRSLAIYAGFAFVLLQVCSIIIPGLFLPEWTMTFIIVLTIIGFPIIAVLSWIYDITPAEGGEAPSTTDTTQPLGVYALTGLVLTVIGVGFWVAISVFGLSFGGTDEVPSIAIIPFDNKGAEEDEFYAYGISSELISDVTSAGLIRVASQKDIEKLDYTALNNEELSEKLFVRYIAQGTLWKIDSLFQLSMELYDTKTSKVLWSESWQKEWNELISIKGNLAENILKTLKVSTKQDIAKVPTSNTEAYEYYLRGKYIYDMRKDMKDTEIAMGLLKKAIKLDNDLLVAKLFLGWTYYRTGEKNKAMKIYKTVLKEATDIDNKAIMASSFLTIGMIYQSIAENDSALYYHKNSLTIAEEYGNKYLVGLNINNIGNVYFAKSKYDKALEYYSSALKIYEELEAKSAIHQAYSNIGLIYFDKGDLDTALDYHMRTYKFLKEKGSIHELADSYNHIALVYYVKGDWNNALEYYLRSLKIFEELGDKDGISTILTNSGNVYADKGNLGEALEHYNKALKLMEELDDKEGIAITNNDIGLTYANINEQEKALEHYNKALKIWKEIGDRYGVALTIHNIGIVYLGKDDFTKAIEMFKKSLNIQIVIGLGVDDLLETTTYLYLTYKHLNIEYDEKEIRSLIHGAENIEFETNLCLYELLDDKFYLDTAYNQVQEKASEMDDAAKFLELLIPAAIVEEWEKVK